MQKSVETISQYYELLEEIGSGTYGKVYKARHLKTDEIVAIKVCFLS